MADGGEGTVDAMISIINGETRSAKVSLILYICSALPFRIKEGHLLFFHYSLKNVFGITTAITSPRAHSFPSANTSVSTLNFLG
ncbi:glycerate kinase [Rossellomorea aquimaris]|jgi:hypothetical protein|uniref:Glycerate kinase n=1 Tax=Rossellomorea aquimaris TaxID=189382 RepID=A0A5D4TA61_9BACI|nr:glycerate kinase [Rossellomorea aquimaris]TYS77223.1 glycerate kinase [Rossellomorea aquimaris]